MRLGGYYSAETIPELESLCEDLDRHGLSAIRAPERLALMSDDECRAFGATARSLGIVVGETGMWENLMTRDESLREARINKTRALLLKADAMGCLCVISLVGSTHPSDSFVAPDPYMITDDAMHEFRDIVLRILDGLDLKTTTFAIEPWCNSFYYEPDRVAEFLAMVDHPHLRLHLDQMNMISQRSYYDTTSLISYTFKLLADRIVAAHLKDLRWDYDHFMLKWDEVLIGDGVLDYETYLTQLAKLPVDTPAYCEHLAGEDEYLTNFARLHEVAARAGVAFTGRDRPIVD